jgi:hypothetical protein
MTGVSWWGHKVDNAYWLWSFQGKILKRCPTDKFCQFLWRPRPPTLLPQKQIKEIKKNLKKYSAEFDLKDKFKSSTKSKEVLEKRRAKLEEFQKFRTRKQVTIPFSVFVLSGLGFSGGYMDFKIKLKKIVFSSCNNFKLIYSKSWSIMSASFQTFKCCY